MKFPLKVQLLFSGCGCENFRYTNKQELVARLSSLVTSLVRGFEL